MTKYINYIFYVISTNGLFLWSLCFYIFGGDIRGILGVVEGWNAGIHSKGDGSKIVPHTNALPGGEIRN